MHKEHIKLVINKAEFIEGVREIEAAINSLGNEMDRIESSLHRIKRAFKELPPLELTVVADGLLNE